jgi:site-specific DNA-methyltransferase (adenine-specific)
LEIENPIIAESYRSKISGFETKKQLELYLVEEPREEYRIELDLDRKP